MSLLPLIVGAGSGVAMWLFSSASQKLDAAEYLDYSIKIEHLKFKSYNELELALKIGIINKAETTWKIKHPTVQVLNKGSVIAENAGINKVYEIKGNATTYIDKAFFTLKTFKLAGVAGQIISEILKQWDLGAGLSVNIPKVTAALSAKINEILAEMSVTIRTEVNGIPLVYTETELAGLGYAPMSAIDRPITSAPANIDKLIPKPNGTKIVWRDKDVFDTAKLMVKVVDRDYEKISEFAKLFKRSTIKETSKAIFDFIYKHIKYNIEDGEQLKNPLVTYDLAQRQAVKFHKENGYWNKDLSADCDDMAIFVASILKNLNIPYTFEVASYKDAYGQDKGYSHVYVNVPLQGGNVIIDPVYYEFNQRKEYSRKFNYSGTGKYVNLNGMDVTYLGSIDNAQSAEELKIKAFLQQQRNELVAQRANSNVIEMFDYALKYWDNPDTRAKALEHLSKAERQVLPGTVGFFGALGTKYPDSSARKAARLEQRARIVNQAAEFSERRRKRKEESRTLHKEHLKKMAAIHKERDANREKYSKYLLPATYTSSENPDVENDISELEGAWDLRSGRNRHLRHRVYREEPQYSGLDGMVWDNLKAFVSKYKIPVAIGTALLSGLVTYTVYNAIQKNKKVSAVPAKKGK